MGVCSEAQTACTCKSHLGTLALTGVRARGSVWGREKAKGSRVHGPAVWSREKASLPADSPVHADFYTGTSSAGSCPGVALVQFGRKAQASHRTLWSLGYKSGTAPARVAGKKAWVISNSRDLCDLKSCWEWLVLFQLSWVTLHSELCSALLYVL